MKILTGAKNEFKLPVLRGIQGALILLQPVTAIALCRRVNATPSIVAGTSWAEAGKAVLAHWQTQEDSDGSFVYLLC